MKSLIAVILILALSPDISNAYSDSMHQLINKLALQYSQSMGGIDPDAYLNRTLGLAQGLDTVVNAQRVRNWIIDGGKEEDSPPSRCLFHFQDPTQDPTGGLLGVGYRTASQWAWNNLDYQYSIYGRNWSWVIAHEYFRIGMTGYDSQGQKVAATPKERQLYLARAFQSLGQVMHLVADMASPPHVRGDFHAFPGDRYERWCESNDAQVIAEQEVQRLVNADQLRMVRWKDLGSEVQYTLDPVFEGFWEMWHDEDFSAHLRNGDPYGISEYTNVNFVSDGTEFRYYTYPSMDEISNENQNTDGPYLKHRTTDGKDVTHFARRSYSGSFLSVLNPFNLHITSQLDENCFVDHAKVLVPKAVEYAAGLLNYFFKTELEVQRSEVFYGIRSSARWPELWSFDAYLIEAGSRSPGEEGTPSEESTSIFIWGIDQAGSITRYDNTPATERCYSKLLFGGPPFQVFPADLSVRASTPGASIRSGFQVSLLPPSCATGQPITEPWSGIVTVFDASSDGPPLASAYADNTNSHFPAFSAPPGREYRIRFEGQVGDMGRPVTPPFAVDPQYYVRLETRYGEIAGDFLTVTDQRLDGHGSNYVMTGKGDYWLTAAPGVAQYGDVTVTTSVPGPDPLETTIDQVCTAGCSDCYPPSSIPGSAACFTWHQGTVVVDPNTWDEYEYPGINDWNAKLVTGDSVLLVDYATSSDGQVSILIPVTPEGYLTGPVPENVPARFGDLFPEAFSGGGTYQLDLRQPICFSFSGYSESEPNGVCERHLSVELSSMTLTP